jgi:hypothetical protein
MVHRGMMMSCSSVMPMCYARVMLECPPMVDFRHRRACRRLSTETPRGMMTFVRPRHANMSTPRDDERTNFEVMNIRIIISYLLSLLSTNPPAVCPTPARSGKGSGLAGCTPGGFPSGGVSSEVSEPPPAAAVEGPCCVGRC